MNDQRTCERFAARLNDLLDQRIDPRGDNEIHEHAARCDRCRVELKTWTAIACTLAPPDQVTHQAARLAVNVPSPRARRVPALFVAPVHLVVTAASACLIFLAVSGLVSWRYGSQEFVDAPRPVATDRPAGVGDNDALAFGLSKKRGFQRHLVVANYQATYLAAGDASREIGRAVVPIGRSFQQVATLLTARTNATTAPRLNHTVNEQHGATDTLGDHSEPPGDSNHDLLNHDLDRFDQR